MTDVRARAEQMLEGIAPGPWRVEATSFHHGPGTEYRVVVDDGNPRATYITERTAKPDAKFIAAAPGLVRGLLDALTETQAERDRIAATLRRTKKERDEARIDSGWVPLRGEQ